MDLNMHLDDICVSLAARGKLDDFLEPRLWEELRLRLQSVYRKATGEQMVVLSVDLCAAVSASPSVEGVVAWGCFDGDWLFATFPGEQGKRCAEEECRMHEGCRIAPLYVSPSISKDTA